MQDHMQKRCIVVSAVLIGIAVAISLGSSSGKGRPLLRPLPKQRVSTRLTPGLLGDGAEASVRNSTGLSLDIAHLLEALDGPQLDSLSARSGTYPIVGATTDARAHEIVARARNMWKDLDRASCSIRLVRCGPEDTRTTNIPTDDVICAFQRPNKYYEKGTWRNPSSEPRIVEYMTDGVQEAFAHDGQWLEAYFIDAHPTLYCERFLSQLLTDRPYIYAGTESIPFRGVPITAHVLTTPFVTVFFDDQCLPRAYLFRTRWAASGDGAVLSAIDDIEYEEHVLSEGKKIPFPVRFTYRHGDTDGRWEAEVTEIRCNEESEMAEEGFRFHR